MQLAMRVGGVKHQHGGWFALLHQVVLLEALGDFSVLYFIIPLMLCMRLLQRLSRAVDWFEDLRPGLILHKAAFSDVNPAPTNSQQPSMLQDQWLKLHGQILRTSYKVPGEELPAFYGMETIVLAFQLVSSRN